MRAKVLLRWVLTGSVIATVLSAAVILLTGSYTKEAFHFAFTFTAIGAFAGWLTFWLRESCG